MSGRLDNIKTHRQWPLNKCPRQGTHSIKRETKPNDADSKNKDAKKKQIKKRVAKANKKQNADSKTNKSYNWLHIH